MRSEHWPYTVYHGTKKGHGTNMKHQKKILPAVLKTLLVLFLVWGTASLVWYLQHFGQVDINAMLFTLHMSLEGTGSDMIGSYVQDVGFWLLTAVAVLLVLELIRFFLARSGKLREHSIRLFRLHTTPSGILLGVWTCVLVGAALYEFQIPAFAVNQLTASRFVEEEYVSPNDVKLTFPEKKKNLIYILLESGESSLQDKEHGGLFDVNYIPNMTQIANENVSFSQGDNIQGAAVAPACGWTMAGMVAEFSGLPLKLYEYDDTDTDNSMGNYAEFMPGAVTLGDILKDAGYKNYYMIGSDATFGGRRNYMQQHGDYQIMDYNYAIEQGWIPSDYFVWWGYEDQKLYQFAKEQLTQISQNAEPFNFTMLTVDTHHIGGWVCPLCQNEHPEQYGNVWSCADRQLRDILDWCKEQPFYEDTVIVIAGDHCSMDPEFYKDFSYDKHHGETTRKVYNAYLNSGLEPVSEKNRRFVTLVLFPTTLAALGVDIEGDRLGLGTNLFSDRETLAEEYGYESMFKELNRRSNFYNEEILYAR